MAILDITTFVQNHGPNSLVVAAEQGNIAVVQAILSTKPPRTEEESEREPNSLQNVAKDQQAKNRALAKSAEKGHTEIVKILVKEEADDLVTALNAAIVNDHLETTIALANLGNNLRFSPLHIAAENGHEEIVRNLVYAGFDINAKNSFLYTPLHSAAQNGHTEVVRFLLAAGCDKDAKEYCSKTPLHYAVENGKEAVIRELLAAGCNKEARDNSNTTPLHYAAWKGNEAVVRFLLAVGCDKDAKDMYGKTPLHFAAENGNEAVVRELLAAKCDKDAKDNKGLTAADITRSRLARNNYPGLSVRLNSVISLIEESRSVTTTPPNNAVTPATGNPQQVTTTQSKTNGGRCELM